MSVRNRPRSTIMREDNSEELNLWNAIVNNIRKCHSINEEYEDLVAKIPEAEKEVSDDDPAAALAALKILSDLQRDCLKHSESELEVLNDEPDELIESLDRLITVRIALEVPEVPQSRDRHAAKDAPTAKPGRNVKRKHDAVANDTGIESPYSTPAPEPVVSIPVTSKAMAAAAGPTPKKVSRSTSASTAAGTTRAESVAEADQAVKNGSSSASGTITANTTPATKFAVGSEVFFRYRQRSNNEEGVGIICNVTNILEGSGPQKTRKYEIQDTEPDDNGKIPLPVKVVASDLVAIPANSQGLPLLQKGKQVIARYPETNTLYQAEVSATIGKPLKQMCRLRFEGEDDVKLEKEVERRYVFDLK